MDIVGEPMVIELFEPRTACVEAAGKPADLGVSFQHRGADAVPAEFVGCREAAEASANDNDMGLPRRRSITHRS